MPITGHDHRLKKRPPLWNNRLPEAEQN